MGVRKVVGYVLACCCNSYFHSYLASLRKLGYRNRTQTVREGGRMKLGGWSLIFLLFHGSFCVTLILLCFNPCSGNENIKLEGDFRRKNASGYEVLWCCCRTELREPSYLQISTLVSWEGDGHQIELEILMILDVKSTFTKRRKPVTQWLDMAG